ncbi:hypothetical protein F5141DRAFT_1211681 [Pisolithus sp. B1]|nr:hypothetical protein F5141DRAFT_1211681 [Pisolithus sp. B1]
MSRKAELPMPGAMLDESQSPLHTSTAHRSPASLTYHPSRTSSTHCHPEVVQTVQGDDLFDEEERMALDHGVVVGDSRPLDLESAVMADEGRQPSSSNLGQPSLQWTSTLRRMRDASESLNGGSKTSYRGSRQDKCHFGEVDYSQALQHELYKKKEIMSGLRMHMCSLKATCHSLEERNQQLQRIAQCELEGQQSKIVELQNIIQQWKEEEEVLHAQLVMDRQTASLQHRNEIESLQQEMKANMDSQLQDMLKESRETISQVLEQCNLELNEKLNTVRAAMRVEKETEIANLEHRYAQCGYQGTMDSRSPQPDSMDTMETHAISSGLSMPTPATSSNQHTSTPMPVAQARPPLPHVGLSVRASVPPARVPRTSVPVSMVTPNLDAIKRLRKKCGLSSRTWLIGVPLEDMNMPRTRSTERKPSVPPPEQPPDLQTSEFTDVLARSVETALKNIFANGQFSQYTRQSPRRRRVHAKEVDEIRAVETKEERNFYLEKFGFTYDMEFIAYEPADQHEVHAYEYKDGPSPNLEHPQFDLTKNSNSPWNSAVLDSLLLQLKDQCMTEQWSTQRPDGYVRQLLVERYKQLRTTWRGAQLKLTDKGMMETPTETEARLVAERQVVLKQCRQTTCRRSRYTQRLTTLCHIVELKTEGNKDDVDAWRWLHKLVETLGEHGMSSDESDAGNDIEVVLCIKNMDWHCSIARELDVVDLQRLVDVDVFSPQGSWPLKRIRAPGNPETCRIAVKGLPMSLYDGAWIASLTQCQLEDLNICEERFLWMQVAIAS